MKGIKLIEVLKVKFQKKNREIKSKMKQPISIVNLLQ